MIVMLIPPTYRDSVCFVYATFDGVSKRVGTAFFLCITKPPARWIVVVTALHVVANAQRDSDDGKTFLRVNTENGGYRFVDVAADKWFKPDMSEEIVDIAFCQWEVLPSASEFDFLCVGSELAATGDVIEAEEIGVGSEVAFAGLFVRHHGKQRNEPIMRFGNICAMPTEPVCEVPTYRFAHGVPHLGDFFGRHVAESQQAKRVFGERRQPCVTANG
jgi:hypothetical protein